MKPFLPFLSQPVKYWRFLNCLTAGILKIEFSSTTYEPKEPNQMYKDATENSIDSRINTATEKEMGIYQFVSDHEGFCGTIKEQCSDFSVKEITLAGQVAHLKNLNTAINHQEFKSVYSISQEKLIKILRDYLTEDVVQEVINFTVHPTVSPLYVNVSHLSKGAQSRLHTCFQKQLHIPNLIMKSTTKDNMRYWELTVPGLQNIPVTKAETNYFPYLNFVLYKENVPSFDASARICRVLKLPVSRLFTAGLKDKRAVTCQMISVEKDRVKTKDLEKVNELLNIKIGNVQLQKKKVNLGELYGNQFEIIVRDVVASEDVIETAVKKLATSGFINYFGLQRFGNDKTSLKDVGRKLLQQDWDGAVQDILKPRDYPELEKLSECRRIWQETQDPERAYNALHHYDQKTREGLLLKGLQRAGPLEALKCLPKVYLQFYIHSYSSFLWNRVVSKRIEKYGIKVLPGDMFRRSSVVTSRSKEDHEISIFDVVVPILGTRFPIPNNEDGIVYQELLEQDRLTEDMVKDCKLYTGHGATRHMIVLPEKFKWSILYYNDFDQKLSVTDYEKLLGLELPVLPLHGERKALKLQFDLKSACYATMALRELMKR